MLSHAPTHTERTTASPSVGMVLQHIQVFAKQAGHFFKTCYVDGLRAIIAGRYSGRQAIIVMLAMTPVIFGVLFVTVPMVLFPTASHQAFHYFARILDSDPTAMVPFFIGTVAATLGLKVPVG